MSNETSSRTSIIINSLRRRARSLRRQALWMQQAFMEGKQKRLTADVVFEILALREESRDLDRLASQYERRLRLSC